MQTIVTPEEAVEREQRKKIMRGKLRTRLAQIKYEYMDEIEHAIRHDLDKAYIQIAKDWGVSLQFVLDTATARKAGRNQHLNEEEAEVMNG